MKIHQVLLRISWIISFFSQRIWILIEISQNKVPTQNEFDMFFPRFCEFHLLGDEFHESSVLPQQLSHVPI